MGIVGSVDRGGKLSERTLGPEGACIFRCGAGQWRCAARLAPAKNCSRLLELRRTGGMRGKGEHL